MLRGLNVMLALGMVARRRRLTEWPADGCVLGSAAECSRTCAYVLVFQWCGCRRASLPTCMSAVVLGCLRACVWFNKSFYILGIVLYCGNDFAIFVG